MIEQFFQCPYCWEQVSVLLDPSVPSQNYIEDCEVCCRPIAFELEFLDKDLAAFQVSSLDD